MGGGGSKSTTVKMVNEIITNVSVQAMMKTMNKATQSASIDVNTLIASKIYVYPFIRVNCF